MSGSQSPTGTHAARSDDVIGRMLVARAISGEADAVQELWREHRRWVAAIILAHKPRESDVDDLLQDVAMTFVRSIGQLRDHATLKPWLRTVAINAALAAGRQATRRREGMTWKLGSGGSAIPGEAGGGPSERSPDERAGSSEESRRVLELAERLPDGYREPLILKCVRGMSYREIGAMMDLPETTVETRIARGRRMLRELASQPEPAMPIGVKGVAREERARGVLP